ncbi:MAG: DUF975 family protein [Nitrospiraceae bacterium]|nr:MAG: DUF975 family protein [Nitrospiraceae bacterium]
MSGKKFSIEDAIKFGWGTVKDNFRFFAGLLVVAFLIENLPVMIANYVRNAFPLVSFVLYLASWFLGFVIQMGLIKVSLKFCDGIKGQMDDLLSSFDRLPAFIAGSMVYALIIIGGLMLFIVPGVIWGIRFSMFPYFILEKGLGPIEALKASGETTAGAKWDLFLLWLLLGLINLAGVIVFVIGLFVTIPVAMVAYTYAYRKLAGDIEMKRPEYNI